METIEKYNGTKHNLEYPLEQKPCSRFHVNFISSCPDHQKEYPASTHVQVTGYSGSMTDVEKPGK
jgi:hypothetical protein